MADSARSQRLNALNGQITVRNPVYLVHEITLLMETSAPDLQPAPEVDLTRYPELGKRYQSIVVDTFVLIALMFAAGHLFESWQTAPESARVVAFLFIWAGYEPIMTALGGTLGQRMLRIRVRRTSDETRPIHLGQSYLRYVVKLLLGWLIFLTMGANTKRRGLHDLAAGSVMVRV
ncbi:MAG: RDD family protein [Flavobacteriales bacterium]|nr:RDD family protein [Flavobacteriales bacterium]